MNNKLLLATATLAVAALTAEGNTFTWKSGRTGNWNDAANWTCAEGVEGYPGTEDTVVVGAGTSHIFLTNDVTVTGITIDSTGLHEFRVESFTGSATLKATGSRTLAGEGGGTLIFDNVIFDSKIADLAGLKQIAIINNGQAFPANSETTEILLVDGGCLYSGWENKIFGKLILQGGPNRIASANGNYTFSFASLETRRGSGVSMANVCDGKVTIRDTSTVEMVGGTQTLADAGSKIPVCTQFLVTANKGTARYGKGLCTMDADGVIRQIPQETMLTSFEGATELDNVCITNAMELTSDVTVNAALFSAATVNLAGHAITAKSGQIREGSSSMWNHTVSNGIFRLCKPNALDDSTNNADVRMQVDFATEGNEDLLQPMLAHDAMNSGYASKAKYSEFTGLFSTPLRLDYYLNSMTAPKAVLEMRGGRLTSQSVMQKANLGGLAGVGYVNFCYNGNNKYGCNIWLGEMSGEDSIAVGNGTVNGAITVGEKGVFYPGLIGYDGGRRGTFKLTYMIQGSVPMMCTFQMKAGGTFGASLNGDGTCGTLEATETSKDGSYVSVVLAGKLSVTEAGRVSPSTAYPIVRYHEGMRTGKFNAVTSGYRVEYDVLQPDGNYAVVVRKRIPGFRISLR